jgi:hypothetical protein
MVAEPLIVEFDETRRAPVVEHMVELADRRRGWINFTPGLDVDEPPPTRTALANLIGAKGPEVPLATWTAPGKKPRDPSTIGIHHAQGPKIVRHLDEQRIPILDGWRVLQDHPKRGLVCAVPTTTDTTQLDIVLEWLLRATGALCRVRRTGEWRALVYE